MIMYGGALLDDDGKQIGSVLIIDAADKAAAAAFTDADPFVAANLFAAPRSDRFARCLGTGPGSPEGRA